MQVECMTTLLKHRTHWVLTVYKFNDIFNVNLLCTCIWVMVVIMNIKEFLINFNQSYMYTTASHKAPACVYIHILHVHTQIFSFASISSYSFFCYFGCLFRPATPHTSFIQQLCMLVMQQKLLSRVASNLGKYILSGLKLIQIMWVIQVTYCLSHMGLTQT